MGQPVNHRFEALPEDGPRRVRIHIVIFEFEGRHAAPHADIEPPVAEVIENANLFYQAKGRIERQEVAQRTEPDVVGRPGYRAQIDARHGHHVQRRRVVLGNVIAVETGFIGGNKLEPLVEFLSQRTIVDVHMIE